MSIPKSFQTAEWRGTTRADEQGCIGISFNLGNEVVRLKLDLHSAKQTSESIQEFLDIYHQTVVQSDNTEEIPSSDVSMLSPAEKV